MKKLITLALLAAVATPVVAVPAASAQSNRELRRDRQEVREEQREYRRAVRSGDPRRIREERRDVRRAQREYREDLRDRDRRWGNDDWRGWRNSNRGLYARGNWRAPFRYQSWRPGLAIGSGFYAPRYRIADPWRYRLPTPGYGQSWVRHYDDLLLVDVRRGRVIRVINRFYW